MSKLKRMIGVGIACLLAIPVCIIAIFCWHANKEYQKSIEKVDSIIVDSESIDKILLAYDKGMQSVNFTNYNDVFDMTVFLRNLLKTPPQHAEWVDADVLNVQMSGGFFRSGILVCGEGKAMPADMSIESCRPRKVTERIYRYP